ncbi:DUF998 domain-containing protein [Modicisalibacter xianhensis]|uniref:DUF998 domain-containing protein n=1 Tax=Modicisalibacter xianhensis TaxID=442341 RepID=A0A1I2YP78_9GAMM|nr:DUF998 domain-containing protein [Halomonas xianhensis]SFH27397.1 Protein of unknown function [Halomonas xianhensis]
MLSAVERKILFVCGVGGLIGCLAVVFGNLVGILVYEQHDPISETISKLAVGQYAWIVDSGMYMFAAGLMACAFGLYRWSWAGARWRAASNFFALLSIDITVIALFNQYAGSHNAGMKVHTYAVYTLYVLVCLTVFFVIGGLREISGLWGRYALWFGLSWSVLTPLYLVTPTEWNGAYERFLGLLLVGGVTAISWVLLRRGRRYLAQG